MLKQRLITAAVLIPITLLLLFFLPIRAFCFLTSIIVLGAAWEWSYLANFTSIIGRVFYLFTMILMISFVFFIPSFLIFSTATIWWCLALMLILLSKHIVFRNKILKSIIGIMVLIPAWAAINFIRAQEDGFYALLFLLLLIWGADSAAYFVGRKWGKHKLAPNISPGKTIEGCIGAFLFGICFAMLALWLCGTESILWKWGVILSIITVFFSIVGDLFESLLKRQAGVKDSGKLLPGHGGLLDRIDSLMAAAPIFVFGAWLIRFYL